MTLLVVIFGFIIAEETLVLMYICIRSDYTSTAAWLTAAVGLAEAVIGSGLAGYLALAKADHTTGGITLEAAKAANFGVEQESGAEESADSPPI